MTEKLEGAATLDRALSIIEILKDEPRPITLAALSEKTDLYKSTILRLIASLEKFGYVRKLEDGRYALGGHLLLLGKRYQSTFRVGEYIEPKLEFLAAKSEFSASFWIKDGSYRLCLFRVPGSGLRDVSPAIGEKCLLHAGGAVSSILLAYGAGADSKSYAAIRQKSVAVSLGEFVPELGAIASPVIGPGDDLVGALCIGGFRSRFTTEGIKRLSSLVQATAKEIGQSLR